MKRAIGGDVFEIATSCKLHLVLFGGGDSVEAVAMVWTSTVFYLSEVDIVIFSTDDINFVEIGFVVAGDDLVAV